jgi:MOSC domain-containing protein YiiM
VESATVLGVYVGLPRPIGTARDGSPVVSSIAKDRVTTSTVTVGDISIDGDAQADLTVHGGPDKAVYAYPAAHYPHWRRAGFDVAVGGLGENLALDAGDEDHVRIGDIWRWGEVRLQVSQPRAPCYKLAIHVGRRGAGAELVRSGRCGWYLRTLTPGRAPTTGVVERIDTDPAEPTVAEAFAAAMGPRSPALRSDAALVARVAASRHLAAQWRAAIPTR